MWESVREFVRYTGPRHVKSTADTIIITCVVCFLVSISSLILADWEMWMIGPRAEPCGFVLDARRDSLIYSDERGDLRLKLLLHVLDRCYYWCFLLCMI